MSKFYVWVDDPQTSSSTQTSTEFANEPQRKQGFQANEVISSKKVNTAVRQANLIAVALMEALSSDNTTLDVNSSVTDVTNEIKVKLATLHTVVIDDIVYGNLNAVTSNAVYKALQNKLNLIEPTYVRTDFVLIKKDFDGSVQQISLAGVFTPQNQYETFFPVLRGLQGQIRGQTAPLAQQNDLDLINRGELTEKLSDKLSTSNIGQGLSFSDNKIKANITKIQDSTSTEFTPDENGVVTIPKGSVNNLGLMKLVSGDGYHGLQMFGAGAIAINPAGKPHIDQRIANIGSGNLSPIISSDINYAVKAALTDDKRIGTETSGTNTAFTDTEKDRACEVLGASRKLYRHYTTFDALGYGSCKLSFISLKSDAYSSAENLSELKDVVSVEYCTIGDSSYLMGTIFINPVDGDYTLMTTNNHCIIFNSDITSGSFTDTVTEL